MIKKIILGVILVILLAVAGFVAIGFLIPQIEYKASVEIEKPRDQVWQLMTDRSKAKEWIAGLQSIEQISGQPDEVGSKSRIILVRDGRTDEFIRELTDIKKPEQISTRLENDYVLHQMTIDLTETDGKTRVTSHENLAGKNFFIRSILAFLTGQSTKLSQKNYDNLKALAEAQK